MASAQHFEPDTIINLSGSSQEAAHGTIDIFEWYPHYQSCQRYFLDHAQHSVTVQALCAFLNIRLPFQRIPHPVSSSSSKTSTPSAGLTSSVSESSPHPAPFVSLIPYIRRLVATGMDSPGVLQGFFGDDWTAGVGYLHEQERRNYLFAAKSGGWAAVKRDYDMPPLETIPFLRPLQGTVDSEIEPRREVGVSGLQWKIGWLDPGLLMLSEVPPHICRVLGAQEGDLHGDKVRCYVPLNNLFEIITLQKVLYHTQQTRSTE